MKTLIINPIGGLANRMRLLAGAITLANDLGVDYKVVWLKNWEINASMEDVFEVSDCLKGKVLYPGALEYGLLYSMPRRKNFYLTALTHRRFGLSFMPNVKPFSDIIAKDNNSNEIKTLFESAFRQKDSCFIQGGIELYPYDVEFYRSLFVPNVEIESRARHNVERLGTQCVGIHIRRTDNCVSITNSPDDVFIEEISRRIELNPNEKYYLATDSEDVKFKFKSIFGNRILCSPQVAQRDSVQGIKDAVVELFTLSHTQLIIGSFYSSFSEAAAMLGNVPLRILKK